MQYSGNTYRKVGSYHVLLGTKAKGVSGISFVSLVAGKINFFFKSGSTIYNASLKSTSNSGNVDLQTGFELKTSNALVNGASVTNLENYNNQGFFYDQSRKVLYYPLTEVGGNKSVVLVYGNVSSSTRGRYESDPRRSFRITSKAYSKQFEIESIGISGNALYFNANRKEEGSKTGFDGVFAFKGYDSSK